MASYDEAIPPGQEGTLRATVRTAHLNGSVRRSIQVTTNEAERPSRTLQVVVNVVGSVQFFPRNRVVLGDRKGMSLEQVLVVRKDPTEKGELKISEPRTDADWLEVAAAPVGSDEMQPPPGMAVRPDDWLLRVRASGTPGPGGHRAEVRFETGLGREPEVAVPVTLALQAALRPSHRKIVLHRPEPGATSEFRLTVSVRRGLDLEALRVSAVPDAFEVESANRDRRTIEVVVRLHHRERMPGRGTLRLDHPEGRMTIPIEVR